MDRLFRDYASDNSDTEESIAASLAIKRQRISSLMGTPVQTQQRQQQQQQQQLTVNSQQAVIVHAPKATSGSSTLVLAQQDDEMSTIVNSAGTFTSTEMSTKTFDELRRAHNRRHAETTTETGESVPKLSRRAAKRARKELESTTRNESDPAGSYVGPWTKPVSQPQPQPQPQTQPELDTTASEPTPSNNVPSEDQSAPNERQADKPSQRIPFGSERSTFHGQSEYDYQGRTYMTPPSDAKIVSNPGSQKCHAPSQLIHTYAGHGGKPVSAIQLLPGSGHLLLSAGMDGTVKLWDINRKRGLLRTFIGHSRNVRAIAFNQTGDKFLSASDDTTVKLWDTETGKCVNEFAGRRGAVPNCLAFSPVESRSFLVGYSDRRILQFSTESNEIEQEYSQHLSAINTITFTPNGKHFISTSNDKTIRYWEYGIPVVLRCIADPTMQVMSSAALHPSGNYIAFQSFDNSIVTCNIGGDSLIRVNRAKVFTGHVVAGYSCKPSFSPDGELLASGDGSGVLRVWSWSQKKIVKTINNAHNKVLIGTTWHPHEDSAMITCSWDGKIKLWA